MPIDIIHDTLDTVINLLRANGALVTPDVRLEAERRIRDMWGGERVYIGRTHAASIQEVSARNKEILMRWSRGERIEFMCRHFGLSERRIREILQIQREPGPSAAVCLIDRRQSGQDGGNAPSESASAPARRRQPRALVRAA